MQIDLRRSGLALVFKDYQEILMKTIWETGSEYSSRDAWIAVNEELKEKGESISRASVINFLNSMVDEKVLDYREETGKGGHRRIYKAAKNEHDFWKHLSHQVREKIIEASGDSKVFTFKGNVVKKGLFHRG